MIVLALWLAMWSPSIICGQDPVCLYAADTEKNYGAPSVFIAHTTTEKAGVAPKEGK